MSAPAAQTKKSAGAAGAGRAEPAKIKLAAARSQVKKQPEKNPSSAPCLSSNGFVRSGQANGAAPHSHALGPRSGRERGLPQRARLETIFQVPLGAIPVRSSPEVDRALSNLGADAAARAGVIYLPRRSLPLAVLAHEVTHALQYGQPASGSNSGARQTAGPAVSAGHAAEREAARNEALVRAKGAGARIDTPRARLSGRDLALKAADAVRADTRLDYPVQQAGKDSAGGADGAADGLTPKPQFKPPPMPDLQVDQEALKQQEQAKAEALQQAGTSGQYVTAFSELTPYQKYLKEPAVKREVDTRDQTSKEDFARKVETSRLGDATATGDDRPLPPLKAIQTPVETTDKVQQPQPAPDAKVADPKREVAKPVGLIDTIKAFFKDLFSFSGKKAVRDSFKKVPETDPKTRTSLGARPQVNTGPDGADRARVGKQAVAARASIGTKLKGAVRAVVTGTGPERVKQPSIKVKVKKKDCCADPKKQKKDAKAEASGASRPDELKVLAQDPVARALYTKAHHAPSRAAVQKGALPLRRAQGKRDSDRAQRLKTSEAERDRKFRKARLDGYTASVKARKDIQAARQTAADSFYKQARDKTAQIIRLKKASDGRIDASVNKARSEVRTVYDGAENKAATLKKTAERDARTEKQNAEKKARETSLWARVKSAVSGFFEALGKRVEGIFKKMRKGVADLFNAARKAAVAAINRAAGWIKKAIDGFAAAAKKAVNDLLLESFPKTAKWLTQKIDQSAKFAKKAVDGAAKLLKAGLTAILSALCKTLDTILAAYQGVLVHGLKIIGAAVTGDFARLGLLILEPILKALGIKPKDFYAAIGKGKKVIAIILSAPGKFLQNLLDAVFGGFRKFGKNLRKHLFGGIIGWLTGALASDIKIPKKWNLLGVLDLSRQILGLTLDMLRRIAVRLLGESAVAKIEFFMDYAKELITKGWAGLFKKILGSLTNLATTVLDAIKTFLLEKVILSAVTWLIGLFNPAGAIAKILMTIWNLIQFLRERMGQIVQVVKTALKFIADIAFRKLKPAVDGIEKVLGNMLPIGIALLANLLGLTGVAAKVQQIMENIRKKIEDAIVKLIKGTVARFTGRGGKGKGGKGKKKGKRTRVRGEDIMKPRKVGKGKERHTISIEIKGKKAVPIMRSEPVPLVAFLTEMKTEAGIKKNIKSTNKFKQAIRNNRKSKAPKTEEELFINTVGKPEVDVLVTTIRNQWPNIDTHLSRFIASVQTEHNREEAEARTGQNQPSGQEADTSIVPLETVLSEIFKAWDAYDTASPVSGLLAPFIENSLRDKTHPSIRLNVLGSANKAKRLKLIEAKTWPEFQSAFLTPVPSLWRNPLDTQLSGGGLLRNASGNNVVGKALKGDVEAEILNKAEQRFPLLSETERGKTTTQLAKERLIKRDPGDSKGQFDNVGKYFLEFTKETKVAGSENTQQKLRIALLSTKTIEQWVTVLFPIIDDSMQVTANKQKSVVDASFKSQVTKKTIWAYLDTAARSPQSAKNFRVEKAENGSTQSGQFSFFEMMVRVTQTPIPAVTPNFKKNKAHAAEMILNFKPNNHEWIERQFIDKVLSKTKTFVSNMSSDKQLGELAGTNDLLHLHQNLVTPTKNLIFDPEPDEGVDMGFLRQQSIPFLPYDLANSLFTNRNDPEKVNEIISRSEHTADLESALLETNNRNAIQAHSGGLATVELANLKKNTNGFEYEYLKKPSLSSSSDAWHELFRQRTKNLVESEEVISETEFDDYMDALIKIYKSTIWDGKTLNGRYLDAYTHDGRMKRQSELASFASNDSEGYNAQLRKLERLKSELKNQ